MHEEAQGMTSGFPAGTIQTAQGSVRHVDLDALLGADLCRLPHVLRILAENAVRNEPASAWPTHVAAIRAWLGAGTSLHEIPFLPGRIMMHDTTCGPALVDIAAMRDVLTENGVDPSRLQPKIPVDVSTDHSSGVDYFGRSDALALNLGREFERNAERYRLMKWASDTLPGLACIHRGPASCIRSISNGCRAW